MDLSIINLTCKRCGGDAPAWSDGMYLYSGVVIVFVKVNFGTLGRMFVAVMTRESSGYGRSYKRGYLLLRAFPGQTLYPRL